MKKIYKIVTDLTPERNKELVDQYDSYDKLLVDKLANSLVMFDSLDEGCYSTSYVISEYNDLDSLKELLYKYEVKFDVLDITNTFLLGKEKIEDDNFKKYLTENLTIDLVLDKISEFGIDSLTELDKSVLKG